MFYVDTSCRLKVFRPEESSDSVWSAIEHEDIVIISALTELETLVQLKSAWKGGLVTRAQWRHVEARLGVLRNQPPFDFRGLRAPLFQTALRQHRNSADVHCRTLDRLHLAAMEELGVSRLMTHDDAQEEAARDSGFEVIFPGTR